MKGRKATVQTVATGLLVAAIQRFTAGSLYQGAVALIIALLLFYGYEYLDLKQLPQNADDILDLTDQAGTTLRDRIDSLRD